jgi:TolB-like protein
MKIIKSSIVAGLLGLLPGFGALAADKSAPQLSVAVYDFSDAEKSGGNYGAKVTALVTANLSAESDIVMVERSDLRKALGEQAVGISGMVNADTAAKIGQITGAKVLVSGQVMKMDKGRLVIVANIVGTETGRLFAEKVDGAAENLTDLTMELSRNVAKNIRDHAAGFVGNETMTHEQYLDRMVKNITGTNRPSVSVAFHFPKKHDPTSSTANSEMSLILQKAGFTVVDSHSEHKPDIEITGVVDGQPGPKKGSLFSCRVVVEGKAQERKTGKIIIIDREIGDAVDTGKMTASRNAQARATDEFAEKILPLLAQ